MGLFEGTVRENVDKSDGVLNKVLPAGRYPVRVVSGKLIHKEQSELPEDKQEKYPTGKSTICLSGSVIEGHDYELGS